MHRFLLSLLIAAPLAAQTTTQTPREPGPPETISVTGTGHAIVAPDRLTFTTGVQTQAPTVEEAVNANNTKMSALIAALKRAGATDEQIRTSEFSLSPQQVYEQGQPPRITGYQASNSVIVTRHGSEIAEAGRLLQAAINAGANQSSGLNFEVSDISRGRDIGMRAAYDDARAKASLLAQAAGRALGRVLSISEGEEAAPPEPRPFAMAGLARAEAVSTVPLASGTRELTYRISVVFEMR